MRDHGAKLVFFGGVVDGVKLALIGSPASLIGTAADSAANHSLNYYVLKFLSADAESAGDEDVNGYDEAAVDEALSAGVLPPTRL